MERNFKILLTVVFGGLSVSLLPVAIAPLGLSSVLGLGMMSALLLGSSNLGSSVLGATVLQSQGFATSIALSYSDALTLGQVLVSLSAIGVLVFTELSDPAYGHVRPVIAEFRNGWKPVALIMVVLFSAIVAVRILAIIH
ncbi:MAG: hypothetical protein JRM80_13295 [Nitrososphaerota archaeon]|nr:hypothetical protein [Nitrososphaerota archaeon]MDG7011225.1 hypothetical protein [Nitrososphaerota archaeon]